MYEQILHHNKKNKNKFYVNKIIYLRTIRWGAVWTGRLGGDESGGKLEENGGKFEAEREGHQRNRRRFRRQRYESG